MHFLLTLVIGVLLSSPALAQAWRNGPALTASQVRGQVLGKGGTVYYPFEDATDSGILNIQCGLITAVHHIVGPADKSTVRLKKCTAQDVACDTCKPICGPVDATPGVDCDILMDGDTGSDEDGDLTPQNTSLYWGFGPLHRMCVDVVGVASLATTNFVLVECGS